MWECRLPNKSKCLGSRRKHFQKAAFQGYNLARFGVQNHKCDVGIGSQLLGLLIQARAPTARTENLVDGLQSARLVGRTRPRAARVGLRGGES